MAFQSTKILELGSCAFRQPHARHSHCRFIHGYKLSAKFWFESKELDENNWVVDFGGLKGLKEILQEQFDHTTCIAADDPALPIFEKLVQADACDLRVMLNGTGIEKIAEWCYMAANKFVAGATDNRCSCVKVEVFEHENNSAVFSTPRETFAPATKQAVTQEDLTRPPFAKEVAKIEKVPEVQKPVEKPVEESKVEKKKKHGSHVPEAEGKEQKGDPPLYGKRTRNTWLNKDSTWGI